MRLSYRSRRIVEKLTGVHIPKDPPRGRDVFKDIGYALPAYQADMVFDVGANVGQSTRTFLRKLNPSRVYCFEPASDTFRLLVENVGNRAEVECCQLALAGHQGYGDMVLEGESVMYFLRHESHEEYAEKAGQTEQVEVSTLDGFCEANRVDRISYLKIDTEGGDLEVLHGSARMLADQKIDLVEVEAGMNPRNTRHVPFEEIKQHLESHRYFLFGLYEQMGEWLSQEPQLRRTNSVYISQRVIDCNRVAD